MIFPFYFYIAISSIKDQVSIFRWRGQFDLSRGGQAVAYGKFMVVSGFITVLIILIIPAQLFFSILRNNALIAVLNHKYSIKIY